MSTSRAARPLPRCVTQHSYEMPLPPRAISLEGHEEEVENIAFFSDGNRIVTASRDHNARVFDTDAARLIYNFSGHKAAIFALAMLGADLVATGDIDGVICVWDAKVESSLYSGKHGDAVWSLAALSPSLFVAGVDDGTLLFFQHRGGEEVTVLHSLTDAHDHDIFAIAAYGQRMVTASWGEKTAKVWNWDSREVLATLSGHLEDAEDVSISANYIVIATSLALHIFDALTLSPLRKLDDKHDDIISTARILGSGHVLTASCDKTIVVSDLATGATVDRVVLDFGVWGAAATSDGRIAACLVEYDESDVSKEFSAIVFPAPQRTARILRAPAAAVAMRILGWRGGRSDKGFYATSEARSWRAAANMPPGF